MKAWDYLGKKHVEVGKKRWVCEWYLWHEDSDPDDEERDPIEDTVCHSRNFPSRALAEWFGRGFKPCWDVWAPVVYQEIFDLEHTEAGRSYGGWETIGEREEIELEVEALTLEVEPLTPAEVSTNSPEVIARLRGNRPDGPRIRTVSSSEIAAHPRLSLSPRDYLPRLETDDE